MLRFVISLFLRVRRVREIAAHLLAEDVRRLLAAKPKNERKRYRFHPYCSACARFGTSDCKSRNVKGWCNKWEAR